MHAKSVETSPLLLPPPYLLVIAAQGRHDALLLVERDEPDEGEAQTEHDRPPRQRIVETGAAQRVEDVEDEADQSQPEERLRVQADAGEDAGEREQQQR